MSLLENKCFINLIKFSSEWQWVSLSLFVSLSRNRSKKTLDNKTDERKIDVGHFVICFRIVNRYSTGTPNIHLYYFVLYIQSTTNWSVWEAHSRTHIIAVVVVVADAAAIGHWTSYIRCIQFSFLRFFFVCLLFYLIVLVARWWMGLYNHKFHIGDLFLSVSFLLVS